MTCQCTAAQRSGASPASWCSMPPRRCPPTSTALVPLQETPGPPVCNRHSPASIVRIEMASHGPLRCKSVRRVCVMHPAISMIPKPGSQGPRDAPLSATASHPPAFHPSADQALGSSSTCSPLCRRGMCTCHEAVSAARVHARMQACIYVRHHGMLSGCALYHVAFRMCPKPIRSLVRPTPFPLSENSETNNPVQQQHAGSCRCAAAASTAAGTALLIVHGIAACSLWHRRRRARL